MSRATPNAVDQLLRFDEPDVAVDVVSAAGAERHEQPLLIVDQFEELFTQNAPKCNRRFAALLEPPRARGRRPRAAVACGTTFSIRCHEHDALAAGLLRAHACSARRPAPPSAARWSSRPLQCGYRFEDDELVDEMLAEVEGERGALPLLAFAAARLWEKRDRETGLLTRQAYHDIGGVGGALARHAEATIDRIGTERIAIVRELFRNLVTAEGTRAVREWNELLSVFSDSHERIARGRCFVQLIDARLLTSYEVREDDDEPTRRVEIIHESLLANWPRLVRWQTQDADAAQLRDQLRQAARTWDEHGRTDDTLWTGRPTGSSPVAGALPGRAHRDSRRRSPRP